MHYAMLHQLKTSNRVSEDQSVEMRRILEELPSEDYLDDLRCLIDSLGRMGARRFQSQRGVQYPLRRRTAHRENGGRCEVPDGAQKAVEEGSSK